MVRDRLDQGKKIKALRMHLSLTQAQFGKLWGVSASAVAGWEQGFRGPHPAILHQIEGLFPLLDISIAPYRVLAWIERQPLYALYRLFGLVFWGILEEELPREYIDANGLRRVVVPEEKR